MKTSRTTTSGHGLKLTLVLVGCIAYVLLWVSAHLILAIQMHDIDAQNEDSWGPVRMSPHLSQCPEVPIWECMRHAMYRKDI